MAKWKPPHPAKRITPSLTCRFGQRYATVDLARGALPCSFNNLAMRLRIVRCGLCKGFHHVMPDELDQHRSVFTEVPQYGI